MTGHALSDDVGPASEARYAESPVEVTVNDETYRLTFPEMAERPVARADHRLAYGGAAPQFGELWLPPGPGPYPVVVLVHGGCWRKDLPGLELVRPLAEALRDRGLAVWNVEYRRIGEEGGGFPGTFLDVAAAADYLRVLAARHPLDLQRLVAVGHSAGGHLALWLAGRARIAADSPLHAADPIAFRHVASIGGFGDLKAAHEYAGQSVFGPETIPTLTGAGSRGEAAYADTSPVNLLPFGVPVTMIVGVFDAAAPPFYDIQYRDAATAKGDDVTVQVLPGAGHFDVIAPWTSVGAGVVEVIVDAAGGCPHEGRP